MSSSRRLAAAALAAGLALAPVAAAFAQSPAALPRCGAQALSYLADLGVDPATISRATAVGMPNGNSGVSEYQLWMTSSACDGGYVVMMQSNCTPMRVHSATGACSIPRR